jgi:hypothetical protein
MTISPGNEQITSIGKYGRLLRPFLNQDILILTIKAPGQIPKLLQIERTHYYEMNDKIFDIDMYVWDNTRNVIEPISFHRFHGQSDSTIQIDI